MQTWSWLEQVFQSGMLGFDHKAHRLFIAQPFASLLMANGADGWINSIHAIYQYTYLRLSQEAWEDYLQKEELSAVREALSKNPKLQALRHRPHQMVAPSGDSAQRHGTAQGRTL